MPTFLLTNVRSLRYKTDDLQCVLHDNYVNVCCVTETWLDSSIPTETINITGFNCFRRDRNTGQKGGGILCYVDSDWPCTVIDSFNKPDLETLWLSLRRPLMPRSLSHIIVCVLYHPPTANSQLMTDHLLECLDTVTQRHPYAGVIVLGDINQMNDRPLLSFPLRQIVKNPTRKQSILDKIYSNIDQYRNSVILPHVGSTDHNTVLTTPEEFRLTNQNKYKEVTIRSNNRNGKNLLANALYNYDWSVLEAIESVDDQLNYFNNVILSLLNYYLPVYTVKRHTNDKPWITDDFRRLIRQRQYALSHGDMVQYKQLRNKVNRMSKTLRSQHYNSKMNQLRTSDPRNWWRETKKLTGQSTKPNLTILANMHTDGDMMELTQLINKTLQNVSSDLTPLSANDSIQIHDTMQNIESRSIQPWEVYHRLSRINIHKSTGPDNIPNWLLRDLAFALAEPICFIFNSSISQSTMPTIWKSANVITIPKSSPPTDVNNDLRPISLTPTLSKILESFIGNWMLERISTKFDPYQYGALKGRSTVHELVHYMHICHQAIEQHQAVRTLFIDFSKAFDHVDHSTVLSKMTALGVQPFIIKWMHSFLSNRQQRVKIDGFTSEWVTLNGGVPQGSWLGPYVFLIHIDDLKAAVNILLKFIDDATEVEILDRNEDSRMQSSVDSHVSWSFTNKMKINTKKTKEMIMDLSTKDNRKLHTKSLTMLDGTIERVSSFKLLGVIIDDNLKWNSHVDKICTRASQRLYFLKLLKRSGMPADDQLFYYKTIIRPVIEYASPVWQSGLTISQRNQIEQVQKRALKIISGSTDYDMSCCNFNIEYLTTRLQTIARTFYNKIAQPNDCINFLLPTSANIEHHHTLRHSKPTNFYCRTNRFYSSFIPYAINNFN